MVPDNNIGRGTPDCKLEKAIKALIRRQHGFVKALIIGSSPNFSFPPDRGGLYWSWPSYTPEYHIVGWNTLELGLTNQTTIIPQ